MLRGGGAIGSVCSWGRRVLTMSPFSSSSSSRSASSSLFSVRRRGVCFFTSASSSAAESSGGEKQEPTARDFVDLRVGKVLKCEKHEDADKMYVEEVDCGEETTRTICSGLVPYMEASQIEGKNVIMVANLKARNMAGVKSYGMLLAVSNDAHDKVELLVAPENAVPGERVRFGENAFVGEPATPNQVHKKKHWEKASPNLVTNEQCEASWKEDGTVMQTSAGAVRCETLSNASIG